MLYKLAARCRGETLKDGDEYESRATVDNRVERQTDLRDDGFRPAKLFSIDRVFRNETMDATHLAEFHQVEGVVADRGLTLADLIGPYSNVFFLSRVRVMLTTTWTQASCVYSSIRWASKISVSSPRTTHTPRSVQLLIRDHVYNNIAFF
jgi:hypothetical protein